MGNDHQADETPLTLWGYRYSVYTRIAKMALTLRRVDYTNHHVDPFADPPDPALTRINPFGRVPVLDHGGFRLFETSAITRYVAAQFPGPALVPGDVRAAARMDQVIGVVDAHGYWPLVRQVFSHAVFRPLAGVPADPEQITLGLAAADPVLRVLEGIAAEGLVLVPGQQTLADLHLAPVIGYFTLADPGRAALAGFPALSAWWRHMAAHPAYTATDPALATLAAEG